MQIESQWRSAKMLKTFSGIGVKNCLGARTALLFLVSAIGLSACGRALPPVPPEAISPMPITNLTVSATPAGVNFTWNGSDSDRRRKELKQIDGYRIYRKELQRPSDAEDRDVVFALIGTVPDTHIAVLEELREEARLAGKPAHRVRVDPALNSFEFNDSSPAPGRTYLYLVKPYNQEDVNGAVDQAARVLFRGEASEVIVMSYADPDDPPGNWGSESGLNSFIK